MMGRSDEGEGHALRAADRCGRGAETVEENRLLVIAHSCGFSTFRTIPEVKNGISQLDSLSLSIACCAILAEIESTCRRDRLTY